MPDQVNDPERPEPLGVAKTTGFAAYTATFSS